MRFVWINENYRVNIESIFSLERRYVLNEDFKIWAQQYEQLIEEYKTNLPPIKDEEGIVHKVSNNSSQEDIQLYSKLIKDEIYDKIGEQPNEYNYTYCIILSTGVKVNISQDKYEEINKIIDSKQFLMAEIDNNLKNKSEIN